MKIELLKAGKLVKTIASSVVTSTGTFTWTTPGARSPATTYQIKIVSTTKTSIFGTSGQFTIS